MTFDEIKPGMFFIYPEASIVGRRIWLAGEKTSTSKIKFFFAEKKERSSQLHYDELAIIELDKKQLADEISMWPRAKPTSRLDFRSFTWSTMRDVFRKGTILCPYRRKK